MIPPQRGTPMDAVNEVHDTELQNSADEHDVFTST